LLIDPKSVRKVAVHARKLAKEFREVCGLLVDHSGVVALVETRNKRRRAGSFWIHPTDWKKIEGAARTLGSEVIGTFHSHVVADPVPGPADIRGAWEGHAMVIIDAWTGELRAWRIRGERAYRLRHRFLGSSANPPFQRTGLAPRR
jgi:proteasome lid subunit RPN8/RPN11